jgi:hypothetical protein
MTVLDAIAAAGLIVVMCAFCALAASIAASMGSDEDEGR